MTLELTDSSAGKYSIYDGGRLTAASVISVDDAIAELEAVNAEIMTVYGGAKGIVTMTYDDGIYDTALILDELCEKYDLYASLMMIASKVKEDNGTLKQWLELFENGRLEPQNHSMTHMPFRSSDPDNLKPENYEYEILDSYDRQVFFQRDSATG